MFICTYCGRTCKTIGSQHFHEKYCKNNPDKIIHNSSVNQPKISYCKYCGKECKNDNSLINHQRLCKQNPNAETHNSLGKPRPDLKGRSPWNKGLTKETDDRITASSEAVKLGIRRAKEVDPNKFTGRGHSEETEKLRKQKLSDFAKSRGFGGKTQGSGRGKHGWYKGFYCDSTYELVYVIYNIDHNIDFKRCTRVYNYEYKNESHKYYPDFELSDGTLIETKGYHTELVDVKLKSVTDRPIKILYENDLKYAFDWVKEHYTYKQLSDLYE